MPSTVGHALCGVSCLLAANTAKPASIPLFPRNALLFMVLANLPDIDFLIGYAVAGDPHAYHQGPTHSLLFALVAGVIAGFAWRGRLGRWPAAAVFSATILSHDVIDMLAGPAPGFNRSAGLALLWPFDSRTISAPVTIFPEILHMSFADLFGWHNAIAIAHEIVVFLSIIALLCIWRAVHRRSRTGRGA